MWNLRKDSQLIWIPCKTVDINECAKKPCKNGGKCKDGVNKYTCTCAAGYTGTTCQTSNVKINFKVKYGFTEIKTKFKLDVLKCYKNEHSFEICHWAWSSKLSCKSAFFEKMTLEVAISVVFRINPELKLSLPFRVIEGQMWRCKPVRLAELPFLYFLWALNQRRDAVLNRTCSSLHNRKLQWNKFRRHIAIYLLLNTRLLRWLESPLASTLVAIAMFPMTSQTTLFGVIGGKGRAFRRVIERFCFHRYLCFHCIFCVRIFCILF